MTKQDSDPEEFGHTWEQVLRDREYPEEVIQMLKAKRLSKLNELYLEE